MQMDEWEGYLEIARKVRADNPGLSREELEPIVVHELFIHIMRTRQVAREASSEPSGVHMQEGKQHSPGSRQ